MGSWLNFVFVFLEKKRKERGEQNTQEKGGRYLLGPTVRDEPFQVGTYTTNA